MPLIGAGIRSSRLQTFATATIASYVGTRTLGTLIQLGQGSQMQNEVLGAAIAIGIIAVASISSWPRSSGPLTPAPIRRRAPGIFRKRPDGGALASEVG